jgi:transcriptional regulator
MISGAHAFMYNPSQFEETRLEVLHGLIRQQPLATLVTLTAEGLVANHIPLYLRVDATPYGTLVGHVARSNPLWQVTDLATQVLAIFQGPASYISPNWYATKQEHGKVVPTWNYAVVHARGPLRAVDDAAWIRAQLQDLTTQQESPGAQPWSVDDAPRDYTERLITALVGIEIPVTMLTGKWKVSQNQPLVNQRSVLQALQSEGSDQAAAMAGLVKTYGGGG